MRGDGSIDFWRMIRKRYTSRNREAKFSKSRCQLKLKK